MEQTINRILTLLESHPYSVAVLVGIIALLVSFVLLAFSKQTNWLLYVVALAAIAMVMSPFLQKFQANKEGISFELEKTTW